MRVLVVGDWHSHLHEEAVYQALKQLGHEVNKFSWHQYFESSGIIGQILGPYLKAQNKYMLGPVVNKLNRDLVNQVELQQPEMVFIYRGTHIYPSTLSKLGKVVPNAVLVGYNNDDPFAPDYPKWKWRHFLSSIQKYDLLLAYRHHNLEDFKQAGANRVELLRSWFISERNFPVELTAEEKRLFACDVVFVGHYEDDGRLEYLEEIVRNGWSLRIFGPGYEWDDVLRRSNILKQYAPVRLVWGNDYNLALCGASIALCFLSKLNRDTYTRRCFEIPASKTVLVSEYSDDLSCLFTDDKEAVFFSDLKQMRDRIEVLLADKLKMKNIAEAGYKRVIDDGHDNVSRMKYVMNLVNVPADR